MVERKFDPALIAAGSDVSDPDANLFLVYIITIHPPPTHADHQATTLQVSTHEAPRDVLHRRFPPSPLSHGSKALPSQVSWRSNDQRKGLTSISPTV